jgi:signal transduction histidine kinase/DNA-binding response OmpR family regulator
MDVTNFLHKFVNKSEDIKEVISLFLQRTGCRFGALFWKKNNTIYELIDHLSLDSDNVDGISFIPCKLISNLHICRDGKNPCGYTCPYELRNIMIIPITVCNDSIGAICIGNKDSEPKEEDIEELSDLISLTQLIVNKSKLIGDYKKIYSDSTYFSKDLFLANMSHEIRTPLNGIIGYNQLLVNTELNDTQKRYLSSVSQCSLQLMQIINDIIDFSKLSSGNMSINDECVSMNEIFSSIEGTMSERIKEKNQKFSYDISSDVPDYIIIDKQKLIQIIINLVSNSINYSSNNASIKVTVSNSNNTLTISVIDNGNGISEQDQCKLFNSFTQIENSRTKTGSGLGLAICKRIVELLDGDINVKSLLGVGSTFYFTAKHKLMADYEKEINQKSQILSNRYILVVDNNIDNRILLGDILFDWKMCPVMCASEKEAIKLVSGNRYNFELGLIDICMSEISGVKLAENIKQMKPLFPLIALSSINGFVDVSNFDGKINKPVNKIQLFNSIYKIVKQNINDDVYIGNSIPSPPSSNRCTAVNSDINSFNKKIKILIAEDILYNQTLLANMVNKIGYNDVTVVSNGEETIQKLDEAHKIKCPYVILLLDLRMPKMDGYEVITHIRNMGYPLPKIVAVTASVLDEDRSRCHDLGVKYFINKPVDMTKLKNVLLKITHIFNTI